MTKYNYFKNKGRMGKRQVGREKNKDKISEEEQNDIIQTAQHIDEYSEEADIENLAKRIGWGKTSDEVFYEEETDWKMNKTEEGTEYSTTVEIKLHKPKSKKGDEYKYGRIQVVVDPKWIGLQAKIIILKPSS
jgi:hypothetical protein